MNQPSLHCNHDLLRRSLDDGLAERDEEAIARHLSTCAECQRELEQLAAKADDWSRVAEALRHDSGEAAVHHDEEGTGAPSYESADFAVDFLEPAVAPQTLGRLGDIDIHEVIGRGGMGIVLRGFQQELNRPVAVKVLAPHLATSGAARRRFTREAQSTAVIVHPHVMPILTVNSSGRLPYLVMPYVACESLQQRLDRRGALQLIDVLRIGLQVSRGLAAAHAQGLVHRDIKPANILLEKGVDRVMLTDFGLARAVDDASLTRTGMIAGTPQYMSPEQARGEAIDARSDLFSLGSVLYALCTGRPPFRAETSYGILRRVTDDAPRPVREINAEIPEWLVSIVLKLLAKEPARRFASADDVAQVLEQCLAHVQQPAAAPLPECCRIRPVQNRWSKPAGISVAVCLLAAGWVGISMWQQRSTSKSPTPDASSSVHAAPQAQSIEDESSSFAWEDGIDRELRDLIDDVDQLQRDASEDWIYEPSQHFKE